MSRFDSIISRRLRASSWIRLAMVWTIWLAPLHWCDLLAADGAGTASSSASASWKRGISRWNGSSYSPKKTELAGTTSPHNPSFGEPAPYTVPVDPKLYTEPLPPMPYEFPQATAKSAQPNAAAGFDVAGFAAPEIVSPPDSVKKPSATFLDVAAAAPAGSSSSPTSGDRHEDGLTMAEPSLTEKPRRWYQYPWRWMSSGWKKSRRLRLGWLSKDR